MGGGILAYIIQADRFDPTRLTEQATSVAAGISPQSSHNLIATVEPVDATLTAIFAEMAVAGASTATTLAETQVVLANEQATTQAIETAVAVDTQVAVHLATQITWTPTASNTPPQRPTYTPIATLNPLDEALHLATTPVANNAQWIPYLHSFNGVEMVLVPAGCFVMGNTDEQIDYPVSLGSQRE